MRRILPFIIVGAVGLLTLGGAAALYQAKKPVTLTKTAEVGDKVHAIGPADAKVTIEEFGDFECPPCAKLSEPINQLKKDFQPNVRIVFRHFPLLNHRHALPAAIAAEAAGMQGKFWEMHDLLYREQPVWSKTADVKPLFNAYAGMLGMNLERFAKDMAGPEATERVKEDQREGTRLGVTNTPTLFLNGKMVPPASLPPDNLRKFVEEAVKGNSPN